MLIKDLDDNLNPIPPRAKTISEEQKEINELASKCIRLNLMGMTTEAVKLLEDKIANITNAHDIAYLLSLLNAIRNHTTSSVQAA
ncbi:MAG: hypothetical protein CBD88_07250 [Flavobacteriales bacterium TMED228]|nr:MAG: hypothetical protein CBD88_07250 [Flavobacteriales bacterium TMED228]